jgi:dTDP-4-dehydrorhamnose reductase
MKPKVAVTGGQGLVGSKFIELFSDVYDFEQLDLSDPVRPVDITQYDQVMGALEGLPVEAVVHFAAYTDVTSAWKQAGDKNGVAYKVNVLGTETITKAANELGAQLIHLSTSYVFDGEKEEMYVETDPVHPIEWYGETKAMAEAVVQDQAKNWTILRIDQPFRSDTFARPDIVRRILAGLEAGDLPPQFTDHHFGPTFIDDFAKVLDWAIRTKTTGLFHASSGERWNDYDFAKEVATLVGKEDQVKPGTLAEYLKTSNRPYQKNTAMSVEKLRQVIDFEMKTVKNAFTSFTM